MIPGAAWPSVKPNQSTPSSVRDSFSKPKAKRDDEDTQQIYCCALTGTCVHIHMHHVHLTPSMCVCYTYIHACVHIQHICMHICIASLTKSVRSIPLRDPLSKNRAYADIQKRTPEFVLWLSYACVHTCMGTQTHVHLPMLTQTHTKNHLEGMPFEKQK